MANKFISGTLILTLSGFVVKAIGSINWIILSRILGGEGIGIYQMAFPIYLLALDISSAGLPIAISIITAEKVAKQDYFGAQRIFHVSLSMLCTTALFLSIVMFFGSSFLIDEHIIRESRAYYSLIALAPAIFFTTIIAGYRGYLQGWQQMTPTALSQIVEQLVRVVVMLGFAALLLPYGLDYAAGGASLGAGAGGFAAWLVLVYYYYKLKRSLPVDGPTFEQESIKHILKRLVSWPSLFPCRVSCSQSYPTWTCSSSRGDWKWLVIRPISHGTVRLLNGHVRAAHQLGHYPDGCHGHEPGTGHQPQLHVEGIR